MKRLLLEANILAQLFHNLPKESFRSSPHDAAERMKIARQE